MGKSRDIHVFVDGSAMVDTRRYGIGWVRTDHKDRKKAEKSKRLPINKGCSTAAEVYAAQDALGHISREANVVVHSDSAAVCEAIARNNFYEKIKKSGKNKTLQKAWESLQRAVEKHKNVFAVFTKEEDHPLMERAHHNAQVGASLQFNDKGHRRSKEKIETKRTIQRELIENAISNRMDEQSTTPSEPLEIE